MDIERLKREGWEKDVFGRCVKRSFDRNAYLCVFYTQTLAVDRVGIANGAKGVIELNNITTHEDLTQLWRLLSGESE